MHWPDWQVNPKGHLISLHRSKIRKTNYFIFCNFLWAIYRVQNNLPWCFKVRPLGEGTHLRRETSNIEPKRIFKFGTLKVGTVSFKGKDLLIFLTKECNKFLPSHKKHLK